MGPCGSSTWQPPPPPSAPPAAGGPRWSCSPTRCARLDPAEVAAGSGYLAGELRQRQTGVGYASLRDLPPPADEPTLTVADVDAAIAEIAAVARRRLAGPPAGAARPRSSPRRPPTSSGCCVGLFSGELRQGAQAGLLADAVARAAEVPVGGGPPGAAARRRPAGRWRWPRSTGGAAALAEFGLQVGRPLAPMLAQSAPVGRRGARRDRHPGRGRREARRHPHPGAPLRRRHRRLHPQPRRDHRRGCPRWSPRSARCRPGSWCSTARRSALDADRPPAAVPGDLQPGRPPHHAQHHRRTPVAPAVLAAAEHR